MKTVRTLILLAVVTMTAFSLSVPLSRAEQENKDIRVVEKAEKITLDIKPGKKSFKVNEPIFFKVKVDKPAYLYIFTISQDGEKVTMLYPNQFDTRNKLKGSAKAVTIPGKSDFKSDREGSESIVVLASATELKLNQKALENSKFFSVGKENLEKSMKDIRVESREKEALQGDVKEFKVTIKGTTK